MRDDTVNDQLETGAKAEAEQQARSQQLWNAWETAQQRAQPLPTEEAIGQLHRCLALCAPVGMNQEERAEFIAAALDELGDMPGYLFRDACQMARLRVDHPSKLVPFIFKETEENWAAELKIAANAKAAWENLNAPRLERRKREPVPEQPDDEQREVAEMMSKLVKSLSANVSP